VADRVDDVLPWWLTRAWADAGAGAPAGGSAGAEVNTGHRDWTLLGTLADPRRAYVDPRGAVTPRPGGWSLDWWVRAGDRWHLPSQEAAVRQRLRDGTPVVETLLGVGEGSLVHRAFAVRASDGGAHLVVEVENRADAVGLALVVRPWNAEGRASVTDIAVDGTLVVVDGRVGVVLPRPPAASHVADGAATRLVDELLGLDDVAAVRAGAAPGARSVHSPVGRAEAAVIVPLPHTATLRVLLPLGAGSGDAGVPVLPAPVPEADQVVAGWKAQTTRGPRIRFPDRRLAALWEAQRRHLLVVHAGDDLASVPPTPFDPTEAVPVLEALAVAGFADEAGQVLAGWRDRQAVDGHVGDDGRRLDGDGAAVVALADHWRRGGAPDLVGGQVEAVVAAAHWIDRRRRSRWRRGGAPAGLLPTGTQPRWVGPQGVAFRDSWWALRGLRDAADLLDAAGEEEAAAAARRAADELAAALVDAQAEVAGPLPVGPSGEVGPGSVAVVDAVLLEVVDPDAPVVDATLAAVRARAGASGAVAGAGGPGPSPRLTARLGRVELARREPAALERLRWLLDHATATATWPEEVHPATGGGAAGAGHDGVAAAEALLLARDLLVRSTSAGLEVCPVLPPEWHGRRWEVHDLLTPHGVFGFAVRWHGDGRPALLWQLDRHPMVEGGPPTRAVRICAPGLDPSWSTEVPSGEVLLERVAPPDPESFAPAPAPADRSEDDPVARLRFPDEAPPTGVTVALPAPALRRRDEGGRP
jgi:hypothetical protein